MSAKGSGMHCRGADLVIMRSFSDRGTFQLRQEKGWRWWPGGEQRWGGPLGKGDNTCKGPVAERRRCMPCAWRVDSSGRGWDKPKEECRAGQVGPSGMWGLGSWFWVQWAVLKGFQQGSDLIRLAFNHSGWVWKLAWRGTKVGCDLLGGPYSIQLVKLLHSENWATAGESPQISTPPTGLKALLIRIP